MSEQVSEPTSSNDSKKKKRRHSSCKRRQSLEEQFQREQQERYDKLVYTCRKALHKELKFVRTFECQKVVRKLKQADAAKAKLLDGRLKRTKSFALDIPTQVCLQRLGIPALNPSVEDRSKDHVAVDDLPQSDRDLLERMLQHKRTQQAMDGWNDKVTDYRQWLLRRQEYLAEGPKPRKKQRQSQGGEQSAVGGLFVQLGGDDASPSATADGEQYAGGIDEYSRQEEKKKNRPGQRARRAKALAIEAAQEGREVDYSLNWREPKKNKRQAVAAKPRASQPRKPPAPSDIVTMGATWKEEGKEHPSWAARQAQKPSIVAFAGKKITFD